MSRMFNGDDLSHFRDAFLILDEPTPYTLSSDAAAYQQMLVEQMGLTQREAADAVLAIYTDLEANQQTGVTE